MENIPNSVKFPHDFDFPTLTLPSAETATLAASYPDEGGKGGEGGNEAAPLVAEEENLPNPQAGAAEGGEEGEEGDAAPFAAFTPIELANPAFVAAIFTDLPEGARPLVTSKAGDPQTGGWMSYSADQIERVCVADSNTYFNCASFLPGDDGSVTARKDSAAAYHALVLDDVGTKVDRKLIGTIAPTWELETSPGNFQIGFKLNPPLTDAAEVERFQHQIAAAGLTDKGAMGMVRWVRLPKGINGKPKYAVEGKPFVCRLHGWNPQAAYTADYLLLALVPAGAPEAAKPTKAPVRARPASDIDGKVYVPRASENPVVAAFKAHGLYKRALSAGKHEVTCPWVHEHTDQLDSGAAYFEPGDVHPTGGFCCQHSHKDQYHIGQVLEHVGLTSAEGRNKALIRTVAGEMKAIVTVLAQRGDLYQSGVWIGVQKGPR